MKACLARVDELNPSLNAVVWRNDEAGLAEAARLSDAIAAGTAELGPLAGVPVPVKDLTPVEGWPVTYGSSAAPEGPSEESELVVEALRRAGCVLTGRTNTPELGPLPVTENRRYGVTRNPWDLARTPGGSSGGAAAAVASGMFPLAHGNDGGGSLRVPASCCGLVGLKASRARVPSLAPAWHGLSVEGGLCRTVADAAALLDAVSERDPLCWFGAPAPERPYSEEVGVDPGRRRVGLLFTPPLGLPLEASPREALERAGRLLERLGHHVEQVEQDLMPAELVPAVVELVNAGYGDLPELEVAKLEAHNAAAIRAGESVGSVTFTRSLRMLQMSAREAIARWGRDFDVLVTPTMSIEPPEAGAVLEEMEASPDAPSMTVLAMVCFTMAFNVAGLPAVSLPMHWSPSGLPVGVQLVAGPWQEDLLVRLASQFEEAAPWAERRPPVSAG
jgi:amidase